MGRKQRNYQLVLTALFCAIIVIQTTIPFLGYIPVGLLNITIIQITVIIAAIVCGPKMGATVGTFWGLITFVRAYFWPTSPLAAFIFINPLISVLPRFFIGLVAGYSYQLLAKKGQAKFWQMSVASVLGSLTNTFLVLGSIYLFYHQKAPLLYHLNAKALLPYLLGLVGTNGVPEAILSGIIAPLIAKPLVSRFKR